MKLVELYRIWEKPAPLIYGITAAVLLLIYFIFYAPLIRQLKKKSLQCRTIEAELQAARQANPALAGPISPLELKLSGISWDGHNSRAIINGEIVAAGDKVYGNTVVKIKDGSVTLNDGAKNIELKIE